MRTRRDIWKGQLVRLRELSSIVFTEIKKGVVFSVQLRSPVIIIIIIAMTMIMAATIYCSLLCQVLCFVSFSSARIVQEGSIYLFLTGKETLRHWWMVSLLFITTVKYLRLTIKQRGIWTHSSIPRVRVPIWWSLCCPQSRRAVQAVTWLETGNMYECACLPISPSHYKAFINSVMGLLSDDLV